MSDAISILRANLFPLYRAPQKLANREQRMDRVHEMLREGLTRRNAFLAGEECDGVIPVTIACHRSDPDCDFIDTWEMYFTAAAWDPSWLQSELDQDQGASND